VPVDVSDPPVVEGMTELDVTVVGRSVGVYVTLIVVAVGVPEGQPEVGVPVEKEMVDVGETESVEDSVVLIPPEVVSLTVGEALSVAVVSLVLVTLSVVVPPSVVVSPPVVETPEVLYAVDDVIALVSTELVGTPVVSLLDEVSVTSVPVEDAVPVEDSVVSVAVEDPVVSVAVEDPVVSDAVEDPVVSVPDVADESDVEDDVSETDSVPDVVAEDVLETDPVSVDVHVELTALEVVHVLVSEEETMVVSYTNTKSSSSF